MIGDTHTSALAGALLRPLLVARADRLPSLLASVAFGSPLVERHEGLDFLHAIRLSRS